MRYLIIIGVCFMLFTAGCLGVGEEKSITKDVQGQAASYKVTAVELYKEYDANSVAADQKYKDKVLEVSGKICNIGEDITGVPYIVLAGDEYGMTGVQCFFGDENVVAGLAKDQQITVNGKCDEMLINVFLRGCILQ